MAGDAVFERACSAAVAALACSTLQCCASLGSGCLNVLALKLSVSKAVSVLVGLCTAVLLMVLRLRLVVERPRGAAEVVDDIVRGGRKASDTVDAEDSAVASGAPADRVAARVESAESAEARLLATGGCSSVGDMIGMLADGGNPV